MNGDYVATMDGDLSSRRLRDLMTALSLVRYLTWRALPVPESIVVRLKTADMLMIRREPTNDLSVAHEVFVQQIYRPRVTKARDDVRLVVDVGANVGYSVVYFARLFPQAKIIAIEPNPINLKVLTRNVELNGLQNRVSILKVAAGISDGTIYLVDRGAASFTTPDVVVSGVKVSVADIFRQLAAECIDVLKIDCEGAEYSIIMDDRFAALRAATLLLEWHATGEHPAANREIPDRLCALDWKVEEGAQYWGQDIRYGLIDLGQFCAYRQT
jgi:FkbM family methyltransferase